MTLKNALRSVNKSFFDLKQKMLIIQEFTLLQKVIETF
jgi:hypothetical protein